MSPINAAKKCFAENIQLFTDPRTEPEKYNLYNGLYNMAEAVERLEVEIRRLQQEVQQLKMRN